LLARFKQPEFLCVIVQANTPASLANKYTEELHQVFRLLLSKVKQAEKPDADLAEHIVTLQ
jgi:hypothetical protein